MPTLAEQYLSGDTSNIKSEPVESDSLADKYLSLTPAEIAAERTRKSVIGHKGNTLSDIASGANQSLSDVGNSIEHGIRFFDRLINSNAKVNLDTGQVEVSGPGAERKKAFDKQVEEEKKNIPENPSTGYNIGRVGGQIAITSALTPIRTISKGADILTKALPTINAVTGAIEKAPLVNRLASATYKGAAVGSEFGALTSSANDKSLGRNIGGGLLAGTVGGPLFELAGIAGKGAAAKLKEWRDISKASGDLSPIAVKNTLQVLSDAGYTPQQVKAELARLGPDATIADLDPAFLAEANALAKSGGTATSLMKGRYQARADQANDAAMQMFEKRLGGVPDLDIAKQRIIDDAHRLTKTDYDAAHASTQILDAKPLIDEINDKLKVAKGPHAQALNTAKSLLYKNEVDASGNKVPENSVIGLHETRKNLDDIIQKAKEPQSSTGRNALNAIKDARAKVDDLLKTNLQMKAADEKFAEKMGIANGLQIGKDAFNNKTNYNQFYKIYSTASPEVQETIREGARGAIGDLMHGGPQGELSASQKLFEKKSLNRDKFTLMFGKGAEDVLDELHNRLNFKRTEQQIEHGSLTAQHEAIQARYGIRPAGNESYLSAAAKGGIADVIGGTPLIATGINTGKRLLSGGYSSYTENRLGAKIGGTADILSRQGAQRDNAVDILNRVEKVRNKPSKESLLRLPVTLPTALTQQYNDSRK
jgi:hypothetical protein